MFDLTSSKLLLLGIIALLVVGPKELPGLLRTVGRYVGMIKRQAAEFRSQFDEAMKESELAELKKQVEDFGKEAESAVREAEHSIQKEVDAVQEEANRTLAEVDAAVKAETDAVSQGIPANGTGAHESLPAPEPASPTQDEVAAASSVNAARTDLEPALAGGSADKHTSLPASKS